MIECPLAIEIRRPTTHLELAALTDRLREYVSRSKAANTVRAYASDWRDFAGWCSARGLDALPARPETVALYLTEQADRIRVSSLNRRLSAIAQAHQLAGLESPAADSRVRIVMGGIRRVKGAAQRGKRPILLDDLRHMVERLPDTPAGTRDRALLLVGFAGAFRRSELVALDIDDLAFGRDGLTVTIRRSKTDQEGQGRRIGIPHGSHPATCPVRALQAWLARLEAEAGPVFRAVDRHGRIAPQRLSDRAVALIVKRAAADAGIAVEEVAGHSLRAGLATAAAAAGVSERAIMAQTGHRSLPTVRRYIREGSLFLENAAGKIGL